MAKAEKKPKKEKPKKEKVKKDKSKKGKGKKGAEENEQLEGEAPVEAAAAESVVPFKKAFSFILGGIAVSVVSLGLGITAGLLLLKPSGDVGGANVSAGAAGSAEISMLDADEAPETEQAYELRSWGTRYNDELVYDDAGFASYTDDEPAHFAENLSDTPEDSASGGVEAVSQEEQTPTPAQPAPSAQPSRQVQPARQAEPVQATQAKQEHVSADNPEHGADGAAPPVLKTPAPKELNKHLEGYAGKFHELSQQMAEYTAASDYGALMRLNESATQSANELFDYAKQAEGSSEGTAYSAYELSSAYSILAEGIHYAARVLENGELFDTELIEMTSESARAKLDSALAGAPME